MARTTTPKKTQTVSRKTTTTTNSGTTKAMYPNGGNRVGRSRPTYSIATDITKIQTTYTRTEQITSARHLYGHCPDLFGAINAKSQWVAGPGAFIPRYTGADRKWGDIACEWAVKNYYPNLCINGPNYSMSRLLQVSSINIDVDGDDSIYFTYSRDGLPRVGLLPSHRIGNRAGQETVKVKGKYEGYRILDGVVVNDVGLPIGIQVLGSNQAKDVIKPFDSFDLLFEPRHPEQFRGISLIAPSRFDWHDRDDIDEFIKRYIKNTAANTFTVQTGDGTANNSAFAIDEDAVTSTATGVDVTPIQGGDFLFLNGKNNEAIKIVDNKNPSTEVEAAMMRMTGRALYSVGWHPALVYSSNLGSAAARQIQDQTRKIIRSRQELLERRARKILLFGISNAMELGLIPRNNKDWTAFSFSTGNQFTIDGGNEAKADIENIKIGLDTYANVCAKQGRDYYDVLTQNAVEGIEFIEKAEEMAKVTGKTFDFCFNLLRQSTPNGNPTVVASPTTTE